MSQIYIVVCPSFFPQPGPKLNIQKTVWQAGARANLGLKGGALENRLSGFPADHR